MSFYQPSAEAAKKTTDDAIVAAKSVATEAFLAATLVSINAAAVAGNYSLNVLFDDTTLNLDHVRNILETRLGYTVVPADDLASLYIEWRSAQRKNISVPNSLTSNPKFNAN